jgi:DnaT-like ssDNA binding protein
MSIFTVTIIGVTPNPEVYGGLTAAGNYVGALLGKVPAAWRALSTDDQGRTLVMATRYIDMQGWPGVATGLAGGTPTTLQWPRSGVTLADGTTVDSVNVPPEFVSATFELAVLIASDPNLPSKVDQGSNLKRADAGGGVGVEYFNPTSAALGTAPRMPQVVAMLLGKFLAGANPGSEFGGFGQSGKSTSDFANCAQIDTRTWPF